ncbi:hypothetical protein J6590_108755 [Homalodisca vitripennis]|nr:hypothetical protein J6590_108755 [Homalodisca vitripennis]
MSDCDEEYCEAFNEAIQECVVLLSEELRSVLNRKRVWVKKWVDRRHEFGASATLFRELAMEDPLDFKRHLRMSVEKFEELLHMVEPIIRKQSTPMRKALTPRQKLETTLHFLATGDSLQSLSLLFRIPAPTISIFLPDVMKAIVTCLKSFMEVPSTTREWENIQRSFNVKWNFPSCCGALDGKHVAIKRPPGSSSEFFNYKGGYSIILLALVDADYRFLYIDVGSNGRANDSSVYRLSSIKRAMDSNQLNWPNDYVIVADDAFPLSINVMKPYSKRNLTLEERLFNYRLSRARRVVENAFCILASRFRIFEKSIDLNLPTVDLIVQCTCILHNWFRTTSSTTYLEKGSVDRNGGHSPWKVAVNPHFFAVLDR